MCPDIIRTFSAFLKFCYIAHQNVITERSLKDRKTALKRSHQYCVVFSGTVRWDGLAGFSLPWQHSLVHYYDNIKNFGAPNGLCSSITELKHIVAIKRPWRRSSRYKALCQILRVNKRLDKLAAARADFTARGMLANPPLVVVMLDLFSNNDSQGDNNGSDDNINIGVIPQGGHGSDGSGTDTNNDGGSNNGSNSDDNDNDENDAGPVESEPLMNEVQLAHEKGQWWRYSMCSNSKKPSD